VPLNSNKATFKLLNSQQKQQKCDGKVPHKKQQREKKRFFCCIHNFQQVNNMSAAMIE
jgi:hypothetical protein